MCSIPSHTWWFIPIKPSQPYPNYTSIWDFCHFTLLQFSSWTNRQRFMPKSCLTQPRVLAPTTRNFRESLFFGLRWVAQTFLTTCPGWPEEHRPCVQEPVREAPGQVGEGGDGRPLQEYLAWPSSTWQESMSLRSMSLYLMSILSKISFHPS